MIFVFDLDDTVCDTDSYSEYYILNYIKKYNVADIHDLIGCVK